MQRPLILWLLVASFTWAQQPQPVPPPTPVPINIPQPAIVQPQPVYPLTTGHATDVVPPPTADATRQTKIISPTTAPTPQSLADNFLRSQPVTVWQPGTIAGLPLPATPAPVTAAATAHPVRGAPHGDSPAVTGVVQLGVNASLGGRRPFPPDNPWNTDISHAPVDPNSAVYIASIGLDKPLHFDPSIPYVVVSGDQPLVPVEFDVPSESAPGPYPIPPNAPIEGGPNARGDRHVLVVDRDNWKLYELFAAVPQTGVGGTTWRASSGAIFDLSSNALRPAGWTSADAAGLPIFPGLIRYDEVFEQQEIRHAVRFTCRRTQRAYVAPARHFASRLTDPNLPPMGMRVRLKADYDISRFPPPARVILAALKKYGMILADNGGDWFVTATSDPRWYVSGMSDALRHVRGRDFEVVQMGALTTQ